jgi:hypothetical protein
MDQAWRRLLVDAVSVGALGPSGAAGAADITRWRVYQIIKDPVSDELVKIAEATVQQRPPRKRARTAPAAADEKTTGSEDAPAAAAENGEGAVG